MVVVGVVFFWFLLWYDCDVALNSQGILVEGSCGAGWRKLAI